jgi:hypothetical protein
MGKDDLYPFVLSPRVLAKLRFVDSLVAETSATSVLAPGTVR